MNWNEKNFLKAAEINPSYIYHFQINIIILFSSTNIKIMSKYKNNTKINKKYFVKNNIKF